MLGMSYGFLPNKSSAQNQVNNDLKVTDPQFQ